MEDGVQLMLRITIKKRGRLSWMWTQMAQLMCSIRAWSPGSVMGVGLVEVEHFFMLQRRKLNRATYH